MQNQSPRRKLTEVLRDSTGERVLICLLVSLSAVLRILYFFQVLNNPFLNYPRLDALFHDLWALSIAHGNFVGDQIFFRAPLYPYILGFLYWIFGHEYLMVRIVQHLLGVASVVLVYQIGKRWFEARTALLAAFLTAVNPMLLYFEGQLLFESFLTFLILLWLFVLSMAIIHRKLLYWFLAGIVLGLLAITRPPVLVAGLVTLLIVGVKTFRKPDVKNWLRPFFSLSIGLVLMIFPVTIRNYFVGDEFVLIASQGGVNFFIGNNPDADGISSSMPGRLSGSWENRNETFFVEQQIGHKPTSSEESSYWYGRAVQFMTHEPWEYLQLQIKKLYLFWNHIEIPNNLNFNFFRHYSPLLDYNPFGFSLLGPLALTGMCVAFFNPGRTGTPHHQPVAVLTFLIIYILVTVTFFVCDRYRAPMIPLFSLFGSLGIVFLIDLQRKRDYKQLLSFLVLMGLFVICVNSNLYALPVGSEAREYFTLGIISHEENENDPARVNFQKAYESDPYFPNLAYNIGVTEWINGNTVGAKEWFHRELQLNPASYNAFINLARIYFAERSMDSVKYFARSAIQLKPYLAPGYVWLAKAMMIEGRISAAESALVHGASLCDRRDFLYGEYLLAGINAAQNRIRDAETRYRAVLAGIAGLNKFQQPLYEPEFAYSTAEKIGEELNVLKAKSYYGLGQISLSKKNLDSAAISFSLATRFDPRYADAFVDLAVTQLRLRRIREADTAMTRAIQLDPNNHLYWLNYGDVLVFENKYTEAARAYEKSLSLRSDFTLAKERLAQLRRMF